MRTTHVLVPALAAAALALSACSDTTLPETPSAPTTTEEQTTVESTTTPEESATASEGETTEDPVDEATSEEAESATEEPTTEDATEETTDPRVDSSTTALEGDPGVVVETSDFANTAGGDLYLASASSAMRDVGLQTSFVFTGEGPIEFQAQYVTEALDQGRGEAYAIEGPAILQVIVRGMRYPEPGEAVITSAEGGEDVIIDPPFEGQTILYIGVPEEGPFTIEVTESPEGIILGVLI